MEALKRFVDIYEHRHEYAKGWKERTGGKVMGYFCTYVPEEILHAAGVLPIRILGSHEPQNVTEPHIFGMFCPFCRDVLAQALMGRYDYLDGIMIAQSCLHVRQSFTSWQKHVPVGFSYYLPMPHKVQSPRSRPFLRAELALFKEKIEDWTGRKITDEALDSSIAVYNRFRALMRQLYDLRKADAPPITGTEAMYISAAVQMMDKTEASDCLEQLLAALHQRQAPREGTRLMIIGSENDDTGLLRMIEGCGSTIVTDDHCTGSRYFWNSVENGKDRLQAIADRYIDRPRCPTKDWEERERLPHILNLAREWNVQGAVLLQQKFCDPHELDMPAIKQHLEKNGIKTLFLEMDVTVPIGQFRIRTEAFLEEFGLEDDLF
ncbi:MAG: benzoyl-CoA reductase, bzd-type, subunit N [Candidatus Thermoplasmatota archaeon]